MFRRYWLESRNFGGFVFVLFARLALYFPLFIWSHSIHSTMQRAYEQIQSNLSLSRSPLPSWRDHARSGAAFFGSPNSSLGRPPARRGKYLPWISRSKWIANGAISISLVRSAMKSRSGKSAKIYFGRIKMCRDAHLVGSLISADHFCEIQFNCRPRARSNYRPFCHWFMNAPAKFTPANLKCLQR